MLIEFLFDLAQHLCYIIFYNFLSGSEPCHHNDCHSVTQNSSVLGDSRSPLKAIASSILH